jgi:6-phosphofructokinase
MSVKTRENLAGSEIQQQRQAIAKAAVDRILSETPRQISMEMYAREVAFIAFAEGWNAKADNIASELAALKQQVQVYEKALRRIDLDYRERSGFPLHIQAYCMRSEAKVALSPDDQTAWEEELAELKAAYSLASMRSGGGEKNL